MSFTKTITANYHFLEASGSDYFAHLEKKFNEIEGSKNRAGSFDTTDSHYLWKVEEKIDINNAPAYFISLAKERVDLPVWFNDKGVIDEISKNDGKIGELYYALISPKQRFIITTSATSGSSAPAFKKMLNEFSLDMGVKMTPLFIDKVDELVMNWGFYKKISIGLSFPLHDDLAEFMATKLGSTIAIMDRLDGLKIDVTLSNSKPKHMLNTFEVRDVISSLIDSELCSKLKVSGGDFDDEAVDNIDIKKAIVRYSEKVVINGSYLRLSDAKAVLMRAYNEQAHELGR